MPGAQVDLAVMPDCRDDFAQSRRHLLVVTERASQRPQFSFAAQRARIRQQTRAKRWQQGHQAGAQPHGVGASGDEAQALAVYRLVKHRRRRGAIADMLMHAPKHLPQQHRADIVRLIGQRDDAPRDYAAIVQEFKLALIARDGAARRRTQSRRDGFDQRRDTTS